MKFKVIYDRISAAQCAFFSTRQQFGMASYETKASHMIAVAWYYFDHFMPTSRG